MYIYIPYFMSYNHYPSLKTSFHEKNDIKFDQNMKWFYAGTKKMSVSTFGTFIKLMKVQCTKTLVSPLDRRVAFRFIILFEIDWDS